MTDIPRSREFEQITQNDLSFEIWREIFRAIVAIEKKALETGETIALTLDLTRNVSDAEDPILRVEVVCTPNAPARFRRVPSAEC